MTQRPLALTCARIWVLLACLFIFASQANAILTVVTNGTVLTRFESSTPGTVTTVTITGMQPGEKLIGIDFRPSNGLLYGIGTSRRLYVLDYITGAATRVGAIGQFDLDLSTGVVSSMDFDPTGDYLRLVNNKGRNDRIDPDTAVKVEGGSDLPITTEGIVAIGYLNNFDEASTTTLYGINTSFGNLVTIGRRDSAAADRNDGFVRPLGPLGLGQGQSFNPEIGLDVAAESGGTLASITVGGESRLYLINRANGVPSLVGRIGDGLTSYGGLAILAGPRRFTNAGAILLPATGTSGGQGNAQDRANPYPATLNVSGMTFPISRLRVLLHDFRHPFPDDIDIMLASPGLKSLILMSDAGGNTSTCGQSCDNNSNLGSPGVTIALDDRAANPLPNGSTLITGSYKPADYADAAADPFPSPAPQNPASAAPTGTSTLRSTFGGQAANGTWGLYIKDDGFGGSGRILGGWSLEVTDEPPCAITCANVQFENAFGQCGRPVEPVPRPTFSGACGTFSPVPVDPAFFPVGTTAITTTTETGASCTLNVTIFDTQPPVVSCRSNITAQADPGQNAAIVHFDPPVVTDNCSATPTYKPASGSFFAVGETTVTGTATDAAGNTAASCTFTVTVTPNSASPTPTATPKTTLANISTRLKVETGDNALIAGFIVTGTQDKKVIIRAIGSSLALPGKLENPTLELRDSSGFLLKQNDDWMNSSLGDKQAIIDSTIPPSNDLESAIVATLPANNAAYTAIVRGVNDTTGIGVVEVYDLDASVDSKLANISTRGLVQTGDTVLIAGTIVLGPSSQKVIIRAIGPSLTIAGKLQDPILELRDSSGTVLETNDNWIDSPNKQAIIDSTIPPANDLESAIVATLPGNGASYTAIVRGVNDSAGIALVEVYALP